MESLISPRSSKTLRHRSQSDSGTPVWSGANLRHAAGVVADAGAQAIRIDAQCFTDAHVRKRPFAVVRAEPFGRLDKLLSAVRGRVAVAMLQVASDGVLEHREQQLALALGGQLSAPAFGVLNRQESDALEYVWQVVMRCVGAYFHDLFSTSQLVFRSLISGEQNLCQADSQ